MYLCIFCAKNLHNEKHGAHKLTLKSKIMTNYDYISDLIDGMTIIFRYTLLSKMLSKLRSKVRHDLKYVSGDEVGYYSVLNDIVKREI